MRPAARRRLALLGLAVIGIALGVLLGLLIRAHSGRTTRPGVSLPATTPTPSSRALPSTPTPAQPPTTALGSTPPPAPSPAPAAAGANADPATVARNFITGYQSFVWSDQPSPLAAARSRAAPWATDALNTELANSSSGAYLTAQRIAAHEVDAVNIVSLDPIDPNRPALRTYLSLVIVTTTRDGTAPLPRERYLQLTLVLQSSGWYVSQVQA